MQPRKGAQVSARHRIPSYLRKEDRMEQIVNLLGQYAFPIVMCLIMAWYVKDQSDKNREDIKQINQHHQEEMTQVTSALNNNTLALQRLTDMIGGNHDKGN